MAVVTISRGSFTGGKTLAECLAQKLSFRCVDRDVIVERAAASGVAQEELLEALLKPPTFLERFQHKRYIYLALIQSALAEEARTGKVVYHGNAGHLLLNGPGPILRVRIIAPLPFRMAMVRDRLKISEKESLDYIQKVDQDRKKWTQFLYGVDWADPNLYDMVLSLERMSISEACDLLSAAIKQLKCFEFTEECQAAMDDLALASRVRATLAIDSSTSHLEVETEAAKGVVRVKGKVPTPAELEDVLRVAKGVAGVTEVDIEGLIPATHV